MGPLASRLSSLCHSWAFVLLMSLSAMASATDGNEDGAAPFYKATQDLLEKQERLASELDAIAESMIRATSNDSPARRALASAKQDFDAATTAFRNQPNRENRAQLENARRALLKATSEFSDIDIDVSALRQRQSDAQTALNDIDAELARLQKTLNGIRAAAEQADAADQTKAADLQQVAAQPKRETSRTSSRPASQSASPSASRPAGTPKRVYPSDAKPVSLGPNFTMLVTPDQVSRFRSDIKRATKGESSRSRRTFRVITQRSNGQELIQDYSMDGLGAGYYISKLKLKAGQNRFLVGGQSWSFTLLPSEENKGYMLILNSTERPAQVTLYPVALAR